MSDPEFYNRLFFKKMGAFLFQVDLDYEDVSFVNITARKVSKCGVFSCPHFPAFGLNKYLSVFNSNTGNTEYLTVFSPNAGKCGVEKNSFFGHFSCSVFQIKKLSSFFQKWRLPWFTNPHFKSNLLPPFSNNVK